jgi:hypothetical protein
MGDALIGVCGGLATELVRWFGIRDQLATEYPNWSKSRGYWIVTFLMCLAGGGLVYLYVLSNTHLNPILALNIGASAPLLIAGLTKAADIKPGRVD